MRVAALVLLSALTACGDDSGGMTGGGGDAGGPGVDGGGSGADGPITPTEDAATFSCAPARMSGHQKVTCGAVSFDVESSEACAGGGQVCGVILDVHGFTMSADQEDTETRMRTLAPPRGYVVVQPTAPGFPASWGNGESDGTVWDFLVATVSIFDIDRDRVHMMGFSQGGWMTNRMICAHAESLASVAPTAGASCFNEGHQPAVEIPILYTHGTTDHLVAFSTATAYRDAALADWPFGEPTVFQSGDGYSATRWTTTSGTDFEFWQHDWEKGTLLGGHCLPAPVGGGTYRCNGDGQFDHSMEILRFFDAHPRN